MASIALPACGAPTSVPADGSDASDTVFVPPDGCSNDVSLDGLQPVISEQVAQLSILSGGQIVDGRYELTRVISDLPAGEVRGPEACEIRQSWMLCASIAEGYVARWNASYDTTQPGSLFFHGCDFGSHRYAATATDLTIRYVDGSLPTSARDFVFTRR